MTLSFVTLLMAFMLTLFLYQVTIRSGDPVAEQFTRIEVLILDTVIDSGGVEVKTGGSE